MRLILSVISLVLAVSADSSRSVGLIQVVGGDLVVKGNAALGTLVWARPPTTDGIDV